MGMERMAQTAPVECSKEIVTVMRSVRVTFIVEWITASSLTRGPMNWLTAVHLLLSDILGKNQIESNLNKLDIKFIAAS